MVMMDYYGAQFNQFIIVTSSYYISVRAIIGRNQTAMVMKYNNLFIYSGHVRMIYWYFFHGLDC